MELGKLKTILGIVDSDQDAALRFIMDDVEETIRNYCNRKDIPSGLINTAYRMAVDLYRVEAVGEGEIPLTVASILEGDTSASFRNKTEQIQGTILKDYRAQLNRYRKLG